MVIKDNIILNVIFFLLGLMIGLLTYIFHSCPDCECNEEIMKLDPIMSYKRPCEHKEFKETEILELDGYFTRYVCTKCGYEKIYN